MPTGQYGSVLSGDIFTLYKVIDLDVGSSRLLFLIMQCILVFYFFRLCYSLPENLYF